MTSDSLLLFHSATHGQHAPASHPDTPERVEELRQAALSFGAQAREPGDFGIGPIAAVHSPELLALLQTAYRRFAQLKDCLLYTSPSPRDGLLSRMPSSA